MFITVGDGFLRYLFKAAIMFFSFHWVKGGGGGGCLFLLFVCMLFFFRSMHNSFCV